MEEMFECPVCNQTFIEYMKYHSHLLTHGDINWSEPHAKYRKNKLVELRREVRKMLGQQGD